MDLFPTALQNEFASWATGYVSCGAADIGEIEAIAAGQQGSSDDAFFDAWSAASDRHAQTAAVAEGEGRFSTAYGHYLRAAAYLTVASHPLYGAPVDPRLSDAFDRQMTAFSAAMKLAEPAVEPVDLTFEGHPMPAWFARARGAGAGEARPVIILTNGYDATVVDLYVAMGQAFRDRGYHCLFFDGPGQGSLLVRDGVAMVPDWERVVTSVVDAALARADVDPARVALVGWSLGGYLALRAASGEHRLAACVADPPLTSVYAGIPALAAKFGLSPAAVAALPELSDADQTVMMDVIKANPELRWKIVSRGFWVNGTTTLREYVASAYEYQLAGRASDIRCPVLVTAAANDPLAGDADGFAATLSPPGTVVHFSALEGAGDHCEMQNRWVVNQAILDWLDRTLGSPAPGR